MYKRSENVLFGYDWNWLYFRQSLSISNSQSKIKEVFEGQGSWEDKEINIKTLQNEGFKNYVQDLDLFIDKD